MLTTTKISMRSGFPDKTYPYKVCITLTGEFNARVIDDCVLQKARAVHQRLNSLNVPHRLVMKGPINSQTTTSTFSAKVTLKPNPAVLKPDALTIDEAVFYAISSVLVGQGIVDATYVLKVREPKPSKS